MEKKAENVEINVFICSAAEDTDALDLFEKHLKNLERQNLVTQWSRKKVSAGSNVKDVTATYIEKSDLVLLLMSPDFFATDYIYEYEMAKALERHSAGLVSIIPIYLRSVDYTGTLLADYKVLPHPEIPVHHSHWENEDNAFLEVIKGLKEKIYEIRNKKIKQQYIKLNYGLIEKRKTSQDLGEKRRAEEALSKISIKQNITAPFDCIVSYYPLVSTKPEPEFSRWSSNRIEALDLTRGQAHSTEEDHHRPIIVLSELESNTPFAVYLNNYSLFKVFISDQENCYKGEVLGEVLVSLLDVVRNQGMKNHWRIARGESKYAGVLSYQPDLRFWKEELNVRFIRLDRRYGCYKLRTDSPGMVKITKPNHSIGEVINRNEVVAVVKEDDTETLISSPVLGSISHWFINDGDLLHKGEIICDIRTHPPLLVVEIDYSISWSGLYSCFSPISGQYFSTVPLVQNNVVLEPGKEINEKSIVCGIKTENLLVAIFVNQCTGKILNTYHRDGDHVSLGDRLFMIAPKYLLIRSPMVGTFYRSKKPWKPPYVKLGQRIKIGMTVCLIEALKLDNEIDSDLEGEIVEIYVEDSTRVNYEEPLFKVRMY